jgi:uncharacterized RDD family membrane protein YckC
VDVPIATETPSFCRACGTRYPPVDGLSFCPTCGTPVVPPAPPVPTGYLRRMTGLVIDWLLLGALVSPIALWFSSMNDPTADEGAFYVIANLLGYGTPFLYWALLTKIWRGQTVGRRLVGTRVARAGDGAQVTYWRALGRAMLILPMIALAFIPVIIDLLFPLFGPRHRSLCDLATDTVVTREMPSALRPPRA